MSELFMRAYYHTFQPTGELCADRILSAVARAGKSAHHTADWYDEWHNIQNAANATAEEVKNLRQRLAEAEAKLTETENGLRWACNTYIVDDYYTGDLRNERLERAVRRVMVKVTGRV